MRQRPLTADERDRRVVEYLLTLNRGEIAEFRLSRLNRVANFRRALIQLIEEFIQARAEDLAAGMLQEYAPPRPQRSEKTKGEFVNGRLPLPTSIAVKKRRMPVWVKRIAESEKYRQNARG